MGRDQHALAGLDAGSDGFVPERQHAGHGVLQAFGQRDLLGGQIGVTAVATLAARIIGSQRRRGCVVAAAPDQHLVIAILLGRFRFVQALQTTVVALVQAVVLDHGQPGAVHFVQRVPQGVDGALEHAGVAQVEIPAFGLEQLAGRHGLRHTGGSQVDIGPAGKAVFEVPGGFAVANEDEFVHGSHSAERGGRNCTPTGSR